MIKLPVRTWILNAAAVFSRRHGAVSHQAQQAGCSRQTVYDHAHKLEERLADTPRPQPAPEPQPEGTPTPRAHAGPTPPAGFHVLLDKDKQKELATTASAMGLSFRQIEALLGVLLPADKVPDHTTLERWVQAETQRATAVLAALDSACADRAETLAIDEIFFGGDRPWLVSSRRA